MKSEFDLLSKKERDALARLFESEGYKVLKKLAENLRLNAATQALQASTWEEVKHLQGQAHGLKQLHLNLKELHKKVVKE